MPRARSYTDDQLKAAVQANHSWRGVLRELGLVATSSSSIRSVRRHADALRCDYTHFRGQRGWTEQELCAAVAAASSWRDVLDALGLVGGSSQSTIRGHVARLGIDVAHLAAPVPEPRRDGDTYSPSSRNISRAGSLLAAGWFTLCGYNVSWPLEPCRYDLMVERGGAVQRVQVKTATVRTGQSWTVWLSTTGAERLPYDIEEIDAFFIIDGDFNYYLIPVGRVGGLHAIQLSAYAAFKVAVQR